MKLVCFVSLLFTYSFSAFSQTGVYKNEFGFRSDNDAYLAQRKDRYYTNGLFIRFSQATDQSKLKPGTEKKIWRLDIGQEIYNPQTGRVPDSRFIDRPFAGYLFAGGSLQWLYKNEHSLKTSVQLGTIGPASLAEDGQEFLHNNFGFYELNGWETQIKNEVGLNFSAEYNHFLYRIPSQKADLALTSYANIGNTFTGAGAGILFRAGLINQFFQSASTNSLVSNNPQTKNLTDKELFFYTVPAINLIAYDATMQGGLFRDDKGPVLYNPKRLVYSQEIGAVFAQKRWTINLSATLKTREVQSRARAHQFGSVSVYYRFN